MNIFETATRKKFRYPTTVGGITTEQLFDLPLTTSSLQGLSLDGVARTISRELKTLTEESFVAKPKPATADLETKLEIVKHVIAAKLAEADAATKRREKAETRRKILDALAKKEDEEIGSKTREQLEKELEALDA